MSDPTPEQVRAFFSRMSQRYGTVYVPKDSDLAMHMAGVFLQAIGVQSSEAFRRFTTTISPHIYLPFTPGEPTADYPLWWQLVVCTHEHVHILQDAEGGWINFKAAYALSKLELVRFEGQAYASQFDLEWWRWKRLPDLDAAMEPLRYYGCDAAHVETAKAIAHQLGATVALGGSTSEAAQFGVTLLQELAPEIREAA
jgi:hypothetical protein